MTAGHTRSNQPAVSRRQHLDLRLRLPITKIAGVVLLFFSLTAGNYYALGSDDAATYFRRIYVPADQVDSWPTEDEKYLPIEASEFNAGLERFNASAGEKVAATIREARYFARLEGDRLVDCTGQWAISVDSSTPVILPLGETTLAVRNARWSNALDRSVRLGIWGEHNAAANTMGLEIAEPGTLEFEWQAPRRDTPDGIELSWRVPPATSSRLILDLPNGQEPLVEGAVVLDVRPTRDDDEAANASRRIWELAVDSSSVSTLRLVESGREPAEQSVAATLRERILYRISHRGLDVEAQWQFDDLQESARELAVRIPTGVRLVSVSWKGGELPWHIEKATPAGTDLAIVKLAEMDLKELAQITLRAWEPLQLDQTWRLPRLMPKSTFWQSGTMELLLDGELELLALEHTDCFQTGGSEAQGPETKPTAHFTMNSPRAAAQVILRRLQPQATVRQGSSLTLSDSDINGRAVTEWQVSRGSLHKLTGKLSPGWVIESVETTPVEAVGEWFIEDRDHERILDIQLARGARPERDVTVTISGRLQRVKPGEPITTEAMRIVEWSTGRLLRGLATFQTAEPYVVETAGDLPQVSSRNLDEHDLGLLTLASDKTEIYDVTNASAKSGLKLSVERARYAAEIRLDAALHDRIISRRYRLTVHPTANGIDRVLVYSTAPLGNEVRWTDQTGTVKLAAERIPAEDPRRVLLPPGGELWLVRLPSLTVQSVDIIAEAAARLTSSDVLPLIAMPEAVEQHGRVYVHADSANVPLLKSQQMRSMPLPGGEQYAADDNLQPIRAAYRYDPTSCLTANGSARLTMRAGPESDMHPLVAQNVELVSFYWANGRAAHRATYELDNDGATSFQLWLPDEAFVKSVFVDGHALEQPAIHTAKRLTSIPLEPGVRSTTVSVCYELAEDHLSAGRRLQPPIIHREIPMLAGGWTIWLPDEYSAKVAAVWGSDGDYGWRQRLFGPLGRPLDESPFQLQSTRDWARLLSPLGSTTPEEPKSSDLSGWSAYRVDFLGEEPVPIAVSHPPLITAWGIAVLLICLVGGRWLTGHRVIFIALVSIAAVAALLLRAELAPVATGALLGLLASKLVTWQRRSVEEPSVSWSRLSTVSFPAILLLLCASQLSHAEPREDIDRKAEVVDETTIERVLIPVDSKGRQTGSKYYVSESLLGRLLKSGADRAGERRWLLLGASYTGELRERSEPAGFVAADWKLTFEVETLARDTTVVLPLSQQDGIWNETAMLDGVPTPLVWHDGGNRCALEIGEPGRYTVAISCNPKTRSSSGRYLAQLSIPKLAGARLRLKYPKTLAGLTVSGTEVAPSGAAGLGLYECDLDSRDRLEVRWPMDPVPATGAQSLRVTGMRWLRVEAKEVWLTAKYVIEGSARRPEALFVEYDRNWELDAQDGTTIASDSINDGKQTVRIALPKNSADRQEVSLRWRLKAATPIGQLRLPPINMISVPVTHRWLAISSDPNLECEVLDSTTTPGTASEFLAIWGESDEPPHQVLGNIRTSRPWILAVRPRKRESLIAEVLHISAESDRLRVAYHADVTPGTAHEYRMQLSVPTNFVIDDVALTEPIRRIPVHWARVDENRVNVFFSEHMKNGYRLVVNGWVARNGEPVQRIPRVSAEGTVDTAQSVQLYRGEGVLLSLSGLPGEAERLNAPTDLPPSSWSTQPVGTYRFDEDAFDAVQLRIEPNKVGLSGTTLLSLGRDIETWSAAYYAQLSVQQGQLDTLRIQVPGNWPGPYTLDADRPAAIEAVPAQSTQRSLLIRFSEPVKAGEAVTFTVRGPITSAGAARLSIPEVFPEPAVEGKKFLLAPTQLSDQPITWKAVGAHRVELPDDLRRPHGPSNGQIAWEVDDREYGVTVETSAAIQPPARVRLADIVVHRSPSGSQLFESRFAVVAPQLVECVLKMPEGQRLVSAYLDGQPAVLHRERGERWRISLGPTALPRMLEVVSSLSADKSWQSTIERPELLMDDAIIPVDLCLWSIGQAPAAGEPRITAGGSITEGDQMALRLDRLVSVVESGLSAAIELPSPDGYNWYLPWAARLVALRGEAVEKLDRTSRGTTISQVSPPHEEQLQHASDQLDQWIEQCNELLALGSEPAIETGASSGLPTDIVPAEQQWAYGVAEGNNASLAVELSPPGRSSRQVRLFGPLAILCLAATGMWLVYRPAAADFIYRWPHAIAFLAGIFYWAWLWPSWLGVVIAAAGLLLAVRSGWPGRSLPMERSTVIRAARNDTSSE